MANIDTATATNDELRDMARDMARDLAAFVKEIDASGLSSEELADLFALNTEPDEDEPAQNEKHTDLVRKLGQELRAEHGTDRYADANNIEEALRNWDRSERSSEQELAGSLFRALVEAGCEEWAAEELADLFALDTDPDLADEPDA